MNIEDKIKIESNNIADQFNDSMETAKVKIINELKKGKVGLAEALTFKEGVHYLTSEAKLINSFYQVKFVKRLFESGFIKSEPLVASKILEEEFRNFFENELSHLQANLIDYLNDPDDQAYFTREFWTFRDLILNYIKQELEAKND